MDVVLSFPLGEGLSWKGREPAAASQLILDILRASVPVLLGEDCPSGWDF